jgi:mono/diheme cytochrome c family protein
MMKPRLISLLLLTATACLHAEALAADEKFEAERTFTLRVLPLLKAKCFACHGEDAAKIKGGLNMLSREGLLKGGDTSQEVLVPGKPEQSDLYAAVTWQNDDLRMPPKENDRLTKEQIDLVKTWIDAGAPWPTEAEQKKHREAEWSVISNAEGEIVKTSGGLADEWTYRRYRPEDLWAFRPVKKPALDEQDAAGAVDQFIAARLAQAGFARSSQADARTLIRRASFDLTGLPPTPEEIAAFESDWRKDSRRAWSELIDRLLASPHYGERWAQHWLDVTRYADTGGMANDYERSNMWRYRDYVIRAFNDDKPYDRFILEQLAGDELADGAAAERLGGDVSKLHAVRNSGDYTEEEARMIVATGFLRLGPWDNAMVTDAEARQIYLDDLVNAVGQTFLSTTMRCVKCHDHKFDPIPTRDYYRLYAALAGTQMAERPLRFTSEENLDRFDERRAFVQRMLDFARKEKDALVNRRETAARAWYAEHNLPYKDAEARKNDPDEMKPPRNVGLDHVAEGQLKVREQDEWIWERALERFEPMVQSVYDGQEAKLAWNAARKLRMPKAINTAWKPKNFIYTGGSLAAPGAEVGPGVLSAPGVPANGASADPYLLPEPASQRRLALARWIAHPQNPLTTRSIVNRVWQYHFGKPLASNPNNFGAKGGKPTHPELLDWLAADFVENGWTLKRLHRQIMMSETYRMAARHPQGDKLKEADPNNDLLAFFPARRLSAEELRDAMLAVSGELNRTEGGLPARPEINMEVALQPRMIQFSLAPSYQPSPTPAERNRRSIYAYRVRGQADPFLEVFNQPNPNESCEIRDSASVSPQAFTLFNSDLMTDRSIGFALRLEREAKSIPQQVDRAFQLALGRAPAEAERERLTAYVEEMRSYHAQVGPEPVVYPVRVTRSLVEEFSGRTFEYEEILPTFENYTPDRKAAEVSAETRALADMCLLLFNSHEFVHAY